MSLSVRHSSSIAVLVAGAFFMENLDGTVIATALPQMAQSFHVGPVSLNVGMTAYMLTLAVFIPISGWIADRFGARTVFGGAIAVFTVSSIFCGLSNGLGEFVGGANHSGHRGRHDGAGGQVGGLAQHGKATSFAGNFLYHLARLGGTCAWPAGWWIYYDLCVLALDLFSQCAARVDRHRVVHHLDRKQSSRSESPV